MQKDESTLVRYYGVNATSEDRCMNDRSAWSEDGVTVFGRVLAGVAGIGLVVLFALGWYPPSWWTAGTARILFYCMIIIAVVQLGEFLWQRVKSK